MFNVNMSEKNICEQLKMNRTDIDVIGMTNDYILTVLGNKRWSGFMISLELQLKVLETKLY